MDTSLPNQPAQQPQQTQDVHLGGVMASATLQPATVRGDDQAQAASVSPVTSQPTIPQPTAPVSTPHKEAAPSFVGTVPHAEPVANPGAEEFVVPSESEPIIQQELAEHGVEAVVDREKPPATQEHRKVGIEPAKESTHVLTQPTGAVQLPMTEEEALKTIKTTGTTESKHWLALLIEKVYLGLKGK